MARADAGRKLGLQKMGREDIPPAHFLLAAGFAPSGQWIG